MSHYQGVEAKGSDGIPAWVMTFADLMSLLLAFFVLLFSFSEMDKNVYKELAGSLKNAFGVQNEVKLNDAPKGINIIAREFSPGRPQPTPENVVRQMTTNTLKLHPVFTDPSEGGQESMKKKSESDTDTDADADADAGAKLSVEEIEELRRVKRDSDLAREVFSEEITKGLIDMEVTQKRIILRVREKASFPSGSAELIAPFKVITNKISKVFGDFDGTIIISGHTDNIPIHTYRFRSNWELSSSRAVSVIHELSKDKKLKGKRFEISAHADTQPFDASDTATARAKNRRVEIILDYSKKNSKSKSMKTTLPSHKVKIPEIES